MDNFGKIKLKYVAYSYASAQKQSEVFECGKYEVYGASGLVGYLNTYGADTEYIGIVKDGAGVGRAQIYKPYTSLLGTMAYIVPIDIKATNINFLKYSIDALDLGNTAGDRATIPHIYFSKYGNEYISSYPIMQQEKIANYLDEKCGKIDELIANQQGQIEKLKEYKQSVITEAVTKGLDKSAPLKDSGIEWIGEIPAHWEMEKIKFNVTINNEKNSGEDLPYIALEHIESFSGKLLKTESVYDINEAIIAEKGEVLFGKLRPYLAKIYLVLDKTYVSSEFAVFHTINIDNHYLRWYLLNYGFLDTVNASTYGTKMPRANIDFIKNLQIPVFDILEQKQIVDYLDEKCGKIDRLIAIKQEKIEKLQEYKKSLIYEYVTGKKEVV